jgi:hypothetical protein
MASASKRGKGAIKWTRLSCHSFIANVVRLKLHPLVGNFMRTLAMPETAEPWSLTSLREKPIKIGVKAVSHGRCVAFHMAEVAVPRKLLGLQRRSWEVRMLHRERRKCIRMTRNMARSTPSTNLRAAQGAGCYLHVASGL